MTSITVRNVPDDVRDELAARAARAGRSLQEHLRVELIQLASRPSVDAGGGLPELGHDGLLGPGGRERDVRRWREPEQMTTGQGIPP